jgi:LuxR family transcriptional regulator, maltose regulon positive regulatory protein
VSIWLVGLTDGVTEVAGISLKQERSLLASKIQAPPFKPDLVSRPELLNKLNKIFDPHIIVFLVLAPPGFGKSALLIDWAHRQGKKIAWYSIEASENNPVFFWQYFTASIQSVFPQFENSFVNGKITSGKSDLHNRLINLINNIQNLGELFVLILDDLHVITNPEILTGLSFLVEHLPQNMKLMLSSQQEPALPIMKMKATGTLDEIRTSDLEFSFTETVELLEKMNVQFTTSEAIQNLVKHTEGWVFGIQLAAIVSSQNNQGLPINSSNRDLQEFLSTEVLNRFPGNIQRFLLDISILDRINPRLCNYITGQSESDNLLVMLEKRNLFLLPIDDRKEWYRFHQSFLDLLRARNSQLPEEHQIALHLKASEWFETNGYITSAFNHALKARAYVRAVSLVEKNLFKMLDHAGLLTQSEMVGKLPADTLHTRPELAVAFAWLLAYTGQCEEAEKYLTTAERSISKLPQKSIQRSLTGKILAVRAYIGWLRGQKEIIIKAAFQALIYLAPEERMNRSITLVSLGSALEENGQLSEALDVYTDAIETCHGEDCSHIHIMACAAKIRLLIHLGSFTDAEALALTTINQVNKQNPGESDSYNALGNVYAHLAEVHRIRNNLPEALAYATEGVRLAQKWGQADTTITTRGIHAAVLWSMGNQEQSLQLFNEIDKQATLVSPWYLNYLESYMALLGVDPEHLHKVNKWLDINNPISESDFTHHDIMSARARVRILCANGKYPEAMNWLELIRNDVEKAGSRFMIADNQVMRAICYLNLNYLEKARLTIIPALEMVETDHADSVFLDKDQMAFDLLQKLVFEPHLEGIVNQLQTLLKQREKMRFSPREERKSDERFPRLSTREAEILGYLATHKTSSDIAKALTVTTNTVRFHIKSIYNKLDVHSRGEAVELARTWNLID